MSLLPEDVEFHAWPSRLGSGGQHVGRYAVGVLAIHKPSGIAFAVASERSQLACRNLALEELTTLVTFTIKRRDMRECEACAARIAAPDCREHADNCCWEWCRTCQAARAREEARGEG